MAVDRQGNLPSLETMSKIELQDLLNRQDKILTNKKFLRTLPDRGKKIETFADKLKQAIKEREDVEATAQMFAKMEIGLGGPCIAEGGVVERIPAAVTHSSDTPTDVPSGTNPYIVDKDAKQSADSTVKSIPNVFLKTDSNTKKKKAPFLPYKSLKSTAIPVDLPKPNVPEEVRLRSSKQTSSSESRVEYTAATPPPLKHDAGTQVVELNESINLLETQKKKVDELLAQQAAEKLAERMHINLDHYSPATPDMSYRDQDEEDGDEEDSDDDSEGTGDEDVEND